MKYVPFFHMAGAQKYTKYTNFGSGRSRAGKLASPVILYYRNGSLEGTERRGAEGVDNEALMATPGLWNILVGRGRFPPKPRSLENVVSFPSGVRAEPRPKTNSLLYCFDYVDW